MTTAQATRRSVLKDGELYLGDNGRCFCAKHAGATATASGRDLSGQRVHRVTQGDRDYAKFQGWDIGCETWPSHRQGIVMTAKTATKQAMGKRKLAVVDSHGTIVGFVTSSATSVGAGKIARQQVEFRRVNGEYCWAPKALS